MTLITEPAYQADFGDGQVALDKQSLSTFESGPDQITVGRDASGFLEFSREMEGAHPHMVRNFIQTDLLVVLVFQEGNSLAQPAPGQRSLLKTSSGL